MKIKPLICAALLCALAGCSTVESAGQGIGHAGRSAGKAIGDTGKAIGNGAGGNCRSSR